jgi:hypothetical protein
LPEALAAARAFWCWKGEHEGQETNKEVTDLAPLVPSCVTFVFFVFAFLRLDKA